MRDDVIARGARAALGTTALLAVGAVPVLGGLPVLAAAPAHATAVEQFDSGQWWREAMGVPAANEQVTGAGVTIALLDTPIYLDAPEFEGQDVEAVATRCAQPFGDDEPRSEPFGPISEVTSHATSMAALMVGNGRGTRPDGRGVAGIAPGASLRVYSLNDRIQEGVGLNCVQGFRDDAEFLQEVLADGPDIVVVTSEWLGGGELDMVELINTGIEDGVVFVASGGNDGPGAAMSGLNSFDGVVNVVAGDQAGAPAEFNSVDQAPVDYLTARDTLTTDPQEGVRIAPIAGGASRATVLAPGVDVTVGGHWEGRWNSDVMNSGTSGAAGLVAGALALAMERWPEASGNQVLQSMVRNANHANELGVATNYGFGGISLASMLSEDATQYPDVHPYYGGLRWAFEDDPPPPIMTGRGEELDDRFWQPTYAEDEQGLVWPLGPQSAGAAPSEPAAASPSAPATPSAPAADGTPAEADVEDDGGTRLPWIWLAAGVVVVALGVAVALRARRNRHTEHGEDDIAPGEGPRTW